MSLVELDLVALTVDLPAHGLKAGDVGTIVAVYPDGEAFEVEFVTGRGTTQAVATLRAGQLRPLGRCDLLTSRPVDAA